MNQIWGYSSAGRASEWHSEGQRFDPAYLHQNNKPQGQKPCGFVILKVQIHRITIEIQTHRFISPTILYEYRQVEIIYLPFFISPTSRSFQLERPAFFISTERRPHMTFTSVPQLQSLEYMMRQVPRYRPDPSALSTPEFHIGAYHSVSTYIRSCCHR